VLDLGHDAPNQITCDSLCDISNRRETGHYCLAVDSMPCLRSKSAFAFDTPISSPTMRIVAHKHDESPPLRRFPQAERGFDFMTSALGDVVMARRRPTGISGNACHTLLEGSHREYQRGSSG